MVNKAREAATKKISTEASSAESVAYLQVPRLRAVEVGLSHELINKRPFHLNSGTDCPASSSMHAPQATVVECVKLFNTASCSSVEPSGLGQPQDKPLRPEWIFLTSLQLLDEALYGRPVPETRADVALQTQDTVYWHLNDAVVTIPMVSRGARLVLDSLGSFSHNLAKGIPVVLVKEDLVTGGL